ncbi:ZIP family metal transporter [Haladaptatus salinisoli]|uniref:ZIP family metal transporter n=1 Tax=Haladaptatus salinisoli TaxID=2884876 RepID=UPI001D0B7081|nr:ZIP family metal transporter [Haladaptatus salinisoli]
MAPTEAVVFVFFAALLTDLAAGLGAVPFFFVEDVSDRTYVTLWGFAAGIMLSASLFGLLPEAVDQGPLVEVASGVVVGALLVFGASRLLGEYKFHPQTISEADFRRLVLIVGTLTVHSFPEGVAVGVSFADLNLRMGESILGFSVPILAIFVTTAIALQNIPEGLAVAIPLKTQGISNWKLVGWAVFSSIPQPLAAIVAFYFVQIARRTLSFGLGFAAGAMLFLVAYELLPEARTRGQNLQGQGHREIMVGFTIGIALMSPLLIVG